MNVLSRCVRVWLAAVLCGLWTTSAAAQTSPPNATAPAQAQQADAPSTYDRIWKFAEWYADSSNPVVQRVLFSGRYQHEFATVSADEDDHSEWNIRRMRRILFIFMRNSFCRSNRLL